MPHLPPAQNVYVKVINLLTAVRSVVDHDPRAVPEAESSVARDLAGGQEQPTQDVGVLGRRPPQRGQSVPVRRDDQHVRRGHRVDIPEREDVLVPPDDVGGYLPGDYFVEYSRRRIVPESSEPYAVPPAVSLLPGRHQRVHNLAVHPREHLVVRAQVVEPPREPGRQGRPSRARPALVELGEHVRREDRRREERRVGQRNLPPAQVGGGR